MDAISSLVGHVMDRNRGSQIEDWSTSIVIGIWCSSAWARKIAKATSRCLFKGAGEDDEADKFTALLSMACLGAQTPYAIISPWRQAAMVLVEAVGNICI